MFWTTKERTGRTGPLCAVNIVGIAALLTAALSIGCGVASTGPDGGSKHHDLNGISSSGYPAGEPKDAGSPALSSSSEAKYSRDQEPESVEHAPAEKK